MDLDVELFLRDMIEKILKDHPEYENIKVKTMIEIRDGKVTFNPYDIPMGREIW